MSKNRKGTTHGTKQAKSLGHKQEKAKHKDGKKVLRTRRSHYKTNKNKKVFAGYTPVIEKRYQEHKDHAFAKKIVKEGFCDITDIVHPKEPRKLEPITLEKTDKLVIPVFKYEAHKTRNGTEYTSAISFVKIDASKDQKEVIIPPHIGTNGLGGFIIREQGKTKRVFPVGSIENLAEADCVIELDNIPRELSNYFKSKGKKIEKQNGKYLLFS